MQIALRQEFITTKFGIGMFVPQEYVVVTKHIAFHPQVPICAASSHSHWGYPAEVSHHGSSKTFIQKGV